jgi:hypothetical protein
LVHWSRAEKDAFNKACFVEGKKRFQLCFVGAPVMEARPYAIGR